MSKFFQEISFHLDKKTRLHLLKRRDWFERQIDYDSKLPQSHLPKILGQCYSRDALSVIIEINCLYQIFIGPISMPSRYIGKLSLGRRIPIRFGKKIRFDDQKTIELGTFRSDFVSLLEKVNIPTEYIYCQSPSDLLYKIYMKEIYPGEVFEGQ